MDNRNHLYACLKDRIKIAPSVVRTENGVMERTSWTAQIFVSLTDVLDFRQRVQ